MKTLIQTLFFFSLTSQICFTQWYPQYGDTTASLYSVHFIDEFNGWSVGHECCGMESSILYTTDGGARWLSKKYGFTNWFNCVYFSNVNYGWIVGDSGQIFHTTNGGANWNTQTSGVMYTLFDMSFGDPNTGWIVGGNSFVGKTILHTTNAGSTWTIQINDTIHPRVQFTGVSFPDVYNGWAVGGVGKIVHTTNGGITWIDQASGTTLWLNDVCFVDSNNGWAVGDSGKILYTTNSGIEWNNQTSSLTSKLYKVCFNNAELGWIVGGDNTILNTTDGGTTWVTQVTNANYGFSDVFFVDANTGWAVGDYGTILHTTNGGVSFVEEEQFDEIPMEFLLSQNYPNPFNPSTRIKYQVSSISRAYLVVYDVLGNEIEILVNEEKPVGIYEVTWYAEDLPSGVYFYQLRTGEFIETKKMILLR